MSNDSFCHLISVQISVDAKRDRAADGFPLHNSRVLHNFHSINVCWGPIDPGGKPDEGKGVLEFKKSLTGS